MIGSPMRVHRGILFSLVLGTMPVLARTQTLDSQIVEQINAASQVRVRLVTGARGTLYAPRADSMSLAYHRSQFPYGGGGVALRGSLSIGQITEIQVTKGSHAGHGATLGGGVGLGLALLAVALCSPSDSICHPSTGEAVRAAVGCTLIGTTVGALIGSISPRWKSIYDVR